ncbi:hypothetical protein H4684_003788 [Desulfomicrobium macestii]|uniref:Uncharacterized protein n=1 Tax=Desulfomicrobium macestii TaxID=90731 RepID=A0ABR9H8V5_9BACT|nr:hypothetical protein [Desulfomicrobium macestii]
MMQSLVICAIPSLATGSMMIFVSRSLQKLKGKRAGRTI